MSIIMSVKLSYKRHVQILRARPTKRLNGVSHRIINFNTMMPSYMFTTVTIINRQRMRAQFYTGCFRKAFKLNVAHCGRTAKRLSLQQCVSNM